MRMWKSYMALELIICRIVCAGTIERSSRSTSAQVSIYLEKILPSRLWIILTRIRAVFAYLSFSLPNCRHELSHPRWAYRLYWRSIQINLKPRLGVVLADWKQKNIIISKNFLVLKNGNKYLAGQNLWSNGSAKSSYGVKDSKTSIGPCMKIYSNLRAWPSPLKIPFNFT